MDEAATNKAETLCKVCGDKASGKHYGVASCDGCRGFFKRSIRRNLEYVCKENGRCIVDVTRRNQCQACRFRKCLQVNMKKDAVQHERAPRTSHQTIHNYGGPLAPRLRGMHGASLFAGLPLHLPGPPMLDPGNSTANVQSPYLQSGFLYPSMLAGFVKPTFLTTGLMSNPNTFSQKYDIATITQRPLVVKDDEVSSSEEASVSTERTNVTDDIIRTPTDTSRKNLFDITVEPTRQNTRTVEMSCVTMLPTENIYESAAKLLFLSVKWARTIPSFLQLSYRDQSILLEESWSELFVLTAAQWSLPIDESKCNLIPGCSVEVQNKQYLLNLFCNINVMGTDVLVSNAITPTTRHLCLEEDARKLRDVIARLTILRVDHTEYACLKALVLFKAECRGICDPTHIELLQDQTHVMLHEYCTSRPCSHKSRFGKLLLSLPAIQSVSRRGLEELLFRKTVGDVAIERLLGDMMKASNN